MLKDYFDDIVGTIIDSKKLIYYAHRFKEINNILNYKYMLNFSLNDSNL